MISLPLPAIPSDRLTHWLDRSLLAIVFVACAFAFSHNLADPDLWGHVQYGRDALASGLPATATYTYTAEGYRWINHENIPEYLSAWGVAGIGPGGLLLVKNLLGLGVLLLIYRQAVRQHVAQTPLCACLLLVALNLVHSWSLRPQLMSYVLFALMIALFDWCFAGWRTPWRAFPVLCHGWTFGLGGWGRASARPQHFAAGGSLRSSPATPMRSQDNALGQSGSDDEGELDWDERQRRLRWLWLLVPIFLVWINAHGGVVAGFFIMTVYLAGRAGEALVWYRQRALPWVMWCGTIVVSCGAATLGNPYGWELHRWLLRALGVPRPEVVEWNPPELLSTIWLAWWCALALSVTALVFTRRPRDLVQLAILGLTIWQACEHRRHIAFFAILFGFWVTPHVDSLLQRWQERRTDSAPPRPWPLPARWAALGVILAAIGAMTCELGHRLQWIRVRVDEYPVAALQYMADQQLGGNLIVSFNWAQYALAAFGPPAPDRPPVKVAFDGRFRTCYPQQVLDMFFDFFLGDAPLAQRYRSPLSPPVDPTRILEYKNPTLILLSRAQEYPAKILHSQRDRWTVLYQDSLAQLWGRRDIYDDPDHPDYLPPEARILGDAEQHGVVPWPALPQMRN
jgi:hypothetical protein